MKITRFAATKSLTVIASLFLAGSLASCDAATRAGTKIAEAIQGAAPSVAAENRAGPVINPAEAAAAIAQLETIPVKGKARRPDTAGNSSGRLGRTWTTTGATPATTFSAAT